MSGKNAIRILLLLLPLFSACDGTGRYLAEQKQMRVVRAYGRTVLHAYATQPSAPNVSQLSCEKVLKQPPPRGVSGCVLYIWNGQVVAELTHWHSTQPSTSYESDMVTRVGKMRGLPSDKQMQRLNHALANDYSRWAKSPAGHNWFQEAARRQEPAPFGFFTSCATFSKIRLPAGVKSCIEGPGPADGPTITLTLADGRSFSVGVR